MVSCVCVCVSVSMPQQNAEAKSKKSGVRRPVKNLAPELETKMFTWRCVLNSGVYTTYAQYFVQPMNFLSPHFCCMRCKVDYFKRAYMYNRKVHADIRAQEMTTRKRRKTGFVCCKYCATPCCMYASILLIFFRRRRWHSGMATTIRQTE